MKQHKAYKFRIYPTKEQEEKINLTISHCRFLWNKFVESFNDVTQTIPKYTKYVDVKAQYPFLKDVSAGALLYVDQHIREFKKQFFNTKRKTKVGSPQSKKRENDRSYKLPNKKFDIRKDKIWLEKIGLININLSRTLPKNAKLMSCTVTRNKSNQYFVSIATVVDVKKLLKTGKTIGIDLGIKDFAILSNGDKHKAEKWFRDNQAKIKKLDKQLKKKTQGSVRYEKTRLRRAKAYAKLTRQREYFQHTLSKELITKYDVFCLETLNVKGMVKNRKLAKAISEASWSSFVSMLKYKALWYGKDVVQIDRFFPSSKCCSSCGTINTTLKLHERMWTCDCGVTHDRDINAAKNIEREGLILRGVGITTPIHTQSLDKTSEGSDTESSTSYEALNKQDDIILRDTDVEVKQSSYSLSH